MRITLLVTVLIGVAAITFAYRNSRFGVETPSYRVVETDGPFEIREYPSMILVGTSLASADVTEGSSFMRLFRYISGSNEAEQNISMTTPVMTSRENGRMRMSFIVPSDVAANGAPPPLEEGVELEELPGGLFAAYRFSGSWNEEKLEAATLKLGQWLDGNDVDAAGRPIVANYDPPFMPPLLRRNEILIRLTE